QPCCNRRIAENGKLTSVLINILITMTDKSIADKPTLVLLHGWGVNQGVWQSIRQRLPAAVSVLTPDLPGFGVTQQFPQPYTLDTVCQVLAEKIPDGSAVCGWSLGGLVALALATRYPKKVG